MSASVLFVCKKNGGKSQMAAALMRQHAGDAITVDYRSVTRPYVIEAIGDARVLEDAFRRSEGGAWVEGLAQHYGVQWSIGRVGEVALPADPGLGVDRARTRR